jgi:hypothetical protein
MSPAEKCRILRVWILIRCFLSRWYRPQKTQNFEGMNFWLDVFWVIDIARRKTQNFEGMNFWLDVFWVIDIARRKTQNFEGSVLIRCFWFVNDCCWKTQKLQGLNYLWQLGVVFWGFPLLRAHQRARSRAFRYLSHFKSFGGWSPSVLYQHSFQLYAISPFCGVAWFAR